MRFSLSLCLLIMALLVTYAPTSDPAIDVQADNNQSGGALLAYPALQMTPTPSQGGGVNQSPAQTSTEEQLNSVYLPPRDRIALAQRLNGVTSIPDPPTSPAQEWQIGDTEDFWVDNVDADEKFQVPATLLYRGERVYMWAQSDYEMDENALRHSAETFERHSYPLVRAAFGSEASPGIDGDLRIHILHATGLGNSVAAYFASESAYPTEAVSTSNEHEMFYVNLDAMGNNIGTAYYDGVLAHELQHMIHWNLDINEDTWLNEGLSELAALLTGFDNAGFAASFLRQPITQINTWPENESPLPNYGASFLFATYFYERFGPEATQQLAANPANGMTGIENTLRQINAVDPLTGQAVTAENLFADWLVANVLRDGMVADGRYTYTLIDPMLPAITTEPITAFPYQTTISLPQYSAHYRELTTYMPRRIRFDFQGADTIRLVPVDAYSGQHMWYSNRGDNSDSALTRAFDLSGVESATLEFYTWYHLEYLWDYGYIMASTDNGASWTLLSTDLTTEENPHNNAYGPGYTGSSGSDLLGPVGWAQQSVDLTPFTGGQVHIRFEVITDDATNQPGMVIDDMGIPEIGYFDDFEKGSGGWTSDGWLYIDNVLTQRWLVQQITRDADGTHVTRLLSPGEGISGSWEFDLGGPTHDVTLIISPLAPVTTETAGYQISLTPMEEE